MISKISFPGLGIGEFSISRIAFHIGKLEVTWYGMIICLGIILGFSYFCYRAGKAGVNFDSVLDFAIIVVPTAIIGARLYYVLFNLKEFHSFYDVIAVWNGGLAIYGGVIVGAIMFYVVCRHKKLGFFKMADMVVPGVMLGQLIGRWGNFMNGEAFGTETTLPWRMGVCNSLTGYQTLYVHPTFLYESLWNLLGFIIINIFYKKKKYDGEITLYYFAWYGFGRMFIEQLRTDSLYVGNTDIRVSALFAFICVIIIVPIMIVARVKQRKLVKNEEISATTLCSLPVILGIKKNGYVKAESAEDSGFDTQEMNAAENAEDTKKVSAKISGKMFSEEEKAEENNPGRLNIDIIESPEEEKAAEAEESTLTEEAETSESSEENGASKESEVTEETDKSEAEATNVEEGEESTGTSESSAKEN